MYRGYEAAQATKDLVRFERTHLKGYVIRVSWLRKEPDTFKFNVKVKLDEGWLNQVIDLTGKQKFIEHFDRLERALCNAVNLFPFEIEDQSQLKQFSNIDG